MNTKNPLYRRLQNREVVNPSATFANSHVDDSTGAPFTAVFSGEFLLTNPLGTFWNPLTQTGAIVLSASADAKIGGCDNVRITANGNSITVPVEWVNVGADSIDTTNGVVNDITIIKKADRIEYIVTI